MGDSLGDRMKSNYEDISRIYLTKRMPTIIRVDGKAFHGFTKGFNRPCDMIFTLSMWDTAKYLCENIMGCKIAYVQSDEISLLLTDFDTLQTQAWFNKNLIKMVSVSAGMATLAFNRAFRKYSEEFCKDVVEDYYESRFSYEKDKKLGDNYMRKIDTAVFDSRVFNVPKEEVCNCFIWRQQDCTRNAIEAAGQFYFSHKELHEKNCNEIQEMLWQEKQINFNDYPNFQKRGVCIVKEKYELEREPGQEVCYRSRWVVDENIPIFTKDREYIEKYLNIEED